MKAFVAALFAMAILATGTSLVLNGGLQKNSADAFATTGVRLGNGH